MDNWVAELKGRGGIRIRPDGNGCSVGGTLDCGCACSAKKSRTEACWNSDRCEERITRRRNVADGRVDVSI